MKRHVLAISAAAAALATAVLPTRAQQSSIRLRDFAMAGGQYYLRVPEFVAAAKATFLRDGDRVIGVVGDGVTKAYPAAAVTWHHGVEDRIGRLPVFVTW
ncbi:MAG: hypothetical protein A3H96_20890 [Acidobacteria bacterium RIFCSPLOWO2_02_FULL_67_36]|nr:MAG: hypothetical protein A3H96_20890 [Acidobacteria bacterium RIFCSPLOWO2_02_FULL_67_36]OFW25447.1 MAG: hypothetical protein A3G21_19365 [Acidobacteria bacterium RIFCSPLOWO2_12_FULL_66_21]